MPNNIDKIQVNNQELSGFLGTSYVESSEYIKLTTDSEGKIIEDIKTSGIKEVNIPIVLKDDLTNEKDITVQGNATINGNILTSLIDLNIIDNSDYLEFKLDSKEHVISGIKKDGTVVISKLEAKGELFDDIEELKDSYNQILSFERYNLLTRWIPYYKGTPEEKFNTNQEYDRCNLLFFTDSHIDEPNDAIQDSTRNLKDTIDFINKCPVRLDAILQGGDNITPFNEILHDTAYAWAKIYYDVLQKSMIPVCCIRGNHDNNDWNNTPENVITTEDFNNLWFDYAERRYGIVRNSNEVNIKVVNGVPQENSVKSMYHYFDIPKHKIRVIAIDVEDIDRVTTDENGHCKFYGTTMNYVGQRQFNWIANTALKGLSEGWGVIFMMHLSIWLFPSFWSEHPSLSFYWERANANPRIQEDLSKLFRLTYAFNNQSTYSEQYTYTGEQYNHFYDLNISADYTEYASMENKPHVICWLMGHEHQDFNTRIGIDGNDNIVVDNENGINFIWTPQAAAWMGASDDRLVKIPGTPTQNCFDIMNIDTVHRKIRMLRYGAGMNCYGVGGDRFLTEGISY